MRTWSESVELVSIQKTPDAGGGYTETEVYREVLANKKSVRQSEFYQANAAGLKADIALEVHGYEYNDEDRIRYPSGDGGRRYRVIRTYAVDFEHIELVCQREVGS